MPNTYLTLARTENQARGIGQYALEFLAGRLGQPADAVLAKVEQFHTDSVACAVAALACGASAPRILRDEALEYLDPRGVGCLGSSRRVAPEKAVVANCAAVRELDANGTNFGYNPRTGQRRGEFGHNDYYPVALAAAQLAGWEGRRTLLAMLCLDEIRGRLAEAFGLKDHKIDHVLHGAIASAAVYGAVLGASAEQIESAIGLVVAHYVPFRAIRHGEQLSDSKGASAALSAEAAVLAMRRAMRGFVGPADIFRNPQAVFCLFERPAEKGTSPFDLHLATGGDDFAVMGMHFKLGLYEHQSAGAIEGLVQLLAAHPELAADPAQIERIRITIYEPAYSIIGDPHKRDPRTRQSADHSMVYIIATLLRKAAEGSAEGSGFRVQGSGVRDQKTGDRGQGSGDTSTPSLPLSPSPSLPLSPSPNPLALSSSPHPHAARLWQSLLLLPDDYSDAALFHPLTRHLMAKIDFRHGGPEYDTRYPDGIPTTLEIDHRTLGTLSSGLVMYPAGHARNREVPLADLLAHKLQRLAGLGVRDVAGLARRLANLPAQSPAEIRDLYSFPLDHVRLPEPR